MATMIQPGVKKGGGGLLGAIGTALGAIGGAAAAPVTGGASLLATAGALAGGAAAGAGVGKLAGGLADKVVDPERPDQQIAGIPTANAMKRRAALLGGGY
jgi:hypothetical protein